MKTKEELNALKKEVEILNGKLAELNEEELLQISGGKMDAEAQDWMNRNIEKVLERAQQKGTDHNVSTLKAFFYKGSNFFNLDEVKRALRMFVDVDDLN